MERWREPADLATVSRSPRAIARGIEAISRKRASRPYRGSATRESEKLNSRCSIHGVDTRAPRHMHS